MRDGIDLCFSIAGGVGGTRYHSEKATEILISVSGLYRPREPKSYMEF